MRVSTVLIGLLLLPPLVRAADIYRCTGDNGEPAFSQHPCGEAATLVQRLAPPATLPGEGLRDTERAWLAARRRPGATGRDNRPTPKAGGNRDAETRRAYQCERRRLALDALQAELRRGYRPAKGERLRRRRKAHEAYLSAFCP